MAEAGNKDTGDAPNPFDIVSLPDRSETLLKIAGRIAQIGGWEIDLPSGRLIFSDEVAAIHEIAPGTSLTLDDAIAFYAPEWGAHIRKVVDACVRHGTPYDIEFQMTTAKGRRIWARAIGQAVRDASGAILRVQGAFQDVTREKRSEQETNRLATRLTTTFESITDAFYTLDRAWRFAYFNHEAERLLQRTRADLLGTVIWEEFPGLAGTTFEHQYRNAVEDNRPVTFEQFYPPLKLWLEVHAYPSDEGLAVYFRDVSGRKEAQEKIRESEERFKSVAKATTDAVWDWNLISDDLWWSDGIQTLFGFAPSEIEPSSISWTSRIHPDDKERVLQGIHEVIEGSGENWSDEYRFLRKDGSSAYVLDRGYVIRNPDGAAIRMVGGMTDQSERKQAEEEMRRTAEQLRVSEAQYRLLFDHNPHPMWLYERTTLRLLAVNRAAVNHYGYSEQEFLAMTIRDLRPQEDVARLETVLSGSEHKQNLQSTWRHLKKDGSVIHVEVVDHGIDFNGRPARLVLANDVTERLRTQQELTRVSRAQQMLSACNEALVRAEDEAALLKQICQVCVEIGGYRLAWVGFAQEDADKTVLPVAHAGERADYLDDVRFSWSADHPSGQGPAGKTVRSGEVVIIPDVTKDESFGIWLQRAQERGYRGVVCLPLRGRGRTFGVLGLYASEVAHAVADEVKLLQSLADDLAFGIINIRSHDERRRLQLAAVRVAAGVSSTTGTEFFRHLAANMAEAVGAQGAFVAQLLPGEPLTARMITAIVDGEVAENFDYVIEGTPCERLGGTTDWVVPDKVADQYPRSPVLAAFGAQAYVGRRLDNSSGEPAGLLFVLFREPLKQSEQSGFITSVLQIFATRASAELERREADARIREQASLLDKAKDAIVVCGIDNRVQFWNKGAERLYGWTAEEAIGQPINELLHEDPVDFMKASRWVLEHGEWSGEAIERRKDGSALTVQAHWTLVQDEDGRPQSIFAIKTDFTQRKAAEQEIQYLAFYDPLTRLPNRQLLMDRLQHALATSARSRQKAALLFIDLDNFKTLNDTLGHAMGDLLLQQVALRLTRCVRESDTVARLGGDEFVVMLENLGTRHKEASEHVKAIGENILSSLNQPFRLEDCEHYSTPSIGVALINDQRDTVGEVLKRADLAMYQAKTAGRNTLRFFDPGMQAAVTDRAVLEADLRQGLRDNDFVLHYQPQANGKIHITGAEALLRWQHHQRGMIPPAAFISLAEETGLIVTLGQWVVETACKQLAVWAAHPRMAQLDLAVNVSARQFRHPDFVEHVLATLDRTGANPQKLKLELTESMLIDNLDDTIAKMTALQAKGVGFALDDFGTGYSSLSYLKRLPLDSLKIDQSFVREVLTDPNDAAIARTIIGLAQSLGLAVIAEGVETEAQREFLARHGCHAYQGYLISRPLPIQQFEVFVLENGEDAPVM